MMKHLATILMICGLLGWWLPFVVCPEVDPAFRRTTDSIKGYGDVPLSIELSYPKGSGPFPAVLVLHGVGANSRVCENFRRSFLQQGFACALLDFRGHGGSGGKHGNWPELVEDARSALTRLRTDAAVDANRVMIVGHSMGANVAYRVADSSLAGVVAIAGRFPGTLKRFPTNLLLATGRHDALVPPETIKTLAIYFTGEDIEYNKLFGDFGNNTALRLFVSESSHAGECFDKSIHRQAVEWACLCTGIPFQGEIKPLPVQMPTMIVQFLSGLAVLFSLAYWLTQGSRAVTSWAVSISRSLGLFFVFAAILSTTVSVRLFKLGPHWNRMEQYCILAALLAIVAAISTRLFPHLPKKLAGAGGLFFDVSFIALSLLTALGVSAVFWHGLCPMWHLMTASLFAGILSICVLLNLAKIPVRDRILFTVLVLCWLFPATMPGY
ncbi:MAG: hypothetical protein C0404_12395 [Verrucomicrobia bacterium]|nr:hypothetical protein [Verrucomicrobiota bacterium]